MFVQVCMGSSTSTACRGRSLLSASMPEAAAQRRLRRRARARARAGQLRRVLQLALPLLLLLPRKGLLQLPPQ